MTYSAGRSHNGFDRRRFLQVALVASAATVMPGALASCSSSGGSGSEKGQLLVWYWGEQEAAGMQSFMKKTVKAYNDSGADKAGDVKAVLQESDSLYTAFRTAAKAKKGPDIQFFWGGTQALEDVWMGNVAPLDESVSKKVLDHVPVDTRRETYWDGHQWGLPFYEINTAFAYNKKMFEKAGLDPDNPPEDWDGFISALKALKKSGVTPLGAGFKDAYLGGWLISYFGAQEFDTVDDAIAPFRGDVEYKGEKYIGWLDRVKELIDSGFFNDDVLSLDLYQGQQLFESGKAAITNSVQPQIVGFERSMGEDTVGVMLAPAWGDGKLAKFFPGASQVLTLTEFSPRKDRGAEFLEYLHTPEVMKAMYEESGAVTPDDRFDADWLTSNVDKYMAKAKTELPSIWYQYYYPFPFERDGVTPAVQQLFQSGGSVKAGEKMLHDGLAKWKREQPEQVEAYQKWELLE